MCRMALVEKTEQVSECVTLHWSARLLQLGWEVVLYPGWSPTGGAGAAPSLSMIGFFSLFELALELLRLVLLRGQQRGRQLVHSWCNRYLHILFRSRKTYVCGIVHVSFCSIRQQLRSHSYSELAQLPGEQRGRSRPKRSSVLSPCLVCSSSRAYESDHQFRRSLRGERMGWRRSSSTLEPSSLLDCICSCNGCR